MLSLEPGRRYAVGRGAAADIPFSDPRVSRLHGELERRGEDWVFTDLGSSNGSYLFRSEDWIDSEASGSDLVCVRLGPGRPARLRPSEGVLLGCRAASFELINPPRSGPLANPRERAEERAALPERGWAVDKTRSAP